MGAARRGGPVRTFRPAPDPGPVPAPGPAAGGPGRRVRRAAPRLGRTRRPGGAGAAPAAGHGSRDLYGFRDPYGSRDLYGFRDPRGQGEGTGDAARGRAEWRDARRGPARRDGDGPGTVTNTSRHAVGGLHVGAARRRGALGTRSALAAVAARTGERRRRRRGPRATDGIGTLDPGQRRDFRLTLPVSGLQLDLEGAYELTVTATGKDRTARGFARTFLPYYPGDVRAEPLGTTVLWPVTDVPHMDALSLRSGDEARPVFRDDALAKEFADGGRLRQVVEAGAGQPVTWVVDPVLSPRRGRWSTATGWPVPRRQQPAEQRRGARR
ncbi:hypothetical protein NKH77_31305 [Streptomyces sp. M19]